jgi:hypothetical protein
MGNYFMYKLLDLKKIKSWIIPHSHQLSSVKLSCEQHLLFAPKSVTGNTGSQHSTVGVTRPQTEWQKVHMPARPIYFSLLTSRMAFRPTWAPMECIMAFLPGVKGQDVKLYLHSPNMPLQHGHRQLSLYCLIGNRYNFSMLGTSSSNCSLWYSLLIAFIKSGALFTAGR